MSKPSADTIAERRLRPVYDWLDNGNNKKAIQEADKVLKKQPDLLCAKVLKGLALLRLGKSKDCEEILDSVKKEVPYDDCTLQAMTICYREIHKLERICDVYENAVAKDPLNEELNTHLFMSYVRVGDYKKQQQVALNLYKIKPKNPYYFWGVMSILMQAQTNNEAIAQKVTLPLAELMVKKFIDEGKIEAEQEVQLYVMILEMQKKYKEALEVIDSELGQKVMSQYMFSRKKIKLLQNLEKWRDLNAYMKKIILEEPDAYNYYVIYIDAVFKVLEEEKKFKESQPEEERPWSTIYRHKEQVLGPDYDIESCVAFIKKCQENNEQPHKLRGPYLASFLLHKKLLECEYNPTTYLGELLELFRKYFEYFSEKACCFKDLLQFLPLIQHDYISLLSATWTMIKQNTDGEAKNKKQMMMYLTHYQLSRYFGIHEVFSVNDKLKQVSRLLDFYHDGHRFSSKLQTMEIAANDTFMILVAHSLHDLYLETGDVKFVKDAISLVAYAFSFSPANHHFKLLLLKFYNTLGASKTAYKYFQLLEIKHMQYDSLGYLQCWTLLYTGQYSYAVHLLENTLKFFTLNYKEAADQLTSAYKYGSFEKVNEFLNFREKLKNSFHYSLVTIEHVMHNLTHSPSHEVTIQTAQHNSINLDKTTAAEFEHLVDNRDLSLFVCYDSHTKRMNEKYTKLSLENDLSLIWLRTVMLKCIKSSINVSLLLTPPSKSEETVNDNNNAYANSNGVDDSYQKHLQTFFEIIEELRNLHKMYLEKAPEAIPKNIFGGVEQSKLFLYVKSAYFLPLFIDAMSFAHEFYNHCLLHTSTEKQVEKIAEISAETFTKLISECNQRVKEEQASYNEIDQREFLEFLAVAVEIICIVCVICGNLHSVLVSSNKKASALTKKKKKKGGKGGGGTTNVSSQAGSAEDKGKEQIDEGILKIYSYYLSIVGDNIKALEIHLTFLESCWKDLPVHKPEFDLQRWRTKDSNKQADINPILGISEKRWFQLLEEVNDNLRDSYVSSIKQMKTMLKHKVEYVSLLAF